MDWNQHLPTIITALVAAGGGMAALMRWQTETRYRELRDMLAAQQETIHIQQETIDRLYDRIASIEAEHRTELEATRREFQELQESYDDLQKRYVVLQSTYDELVKTYGDLKTAYDGLAAKPPRKSRGTSHL